MRDDCPRLARGGLSPAEGGLSPVAGGGLSPVARAGLSPVEGGLSPVARVIDGKYGEFFLPRKARNRVSPDAETITKRDLRANQSYLRHFPSGRKVIGETRRENFVNHFPDQKTFRVFRGKHPRAREDCPRLAIQISVTHWGQPHQCENSPHRNLILLDAPGTSPM